MILPPHPALRRLLAVGAVPVRVVERLGKTPRAFELLARDFAELDILPERQLEPLLRGIDLSGMAASSTRATARGRAASGTPPRGRSQFRSTGRALARESERADSAEVESEASHEADLAIARRGFAGAPADEIEQSRFPSGTSERFDTAPRRAASLGIAAQDPAAAPRGIEKNIEQSGDRPGRRSSRIEAGAADKSHSRAAAREALRRRALRAGDESIADREISRAQARAGVTELLERASRQIDTSLASSNRQEERRASSAVSSDTSDAAGSIARIARVVDDLRTRSCNVPGDRLGRPRVARAATPAADDEEPHADTDALAETGLRGLVSRAKKFEPKGIAIERPAVAKEPEDFARHLDEVLRNEARRNGIDLARLNR